MGNHRITFSDCMFRRWQIEADTFSDLSPYLRHVRAFAAFADERAVDRELVAVWRERLQELGRTAETINGMMISLNSFFQFSGQIECKAKLLRIQRRAFRDEGHELSREEYKRLLATARSEGKPRLALLMETICGTGIRVSELAYITAMLCGVAKRK